MFDEVDINGDGGISKEEFDAAFGKGHLAGGVSFLPLASLFLPLVSLFAALVSLFQAYSSRQSVPPPRQSLSCWPIPPPQSIPPCRQVAYLLKRQLSSPAN